MASQPKPASHEAVNGAVSAALNCALELGIPGLCRIRFKPSQQLQIHFIHSRPFPDDPIAGSGFQNVILLPPALEAAAFSQRLLAVRMNVGRVRAGTRPEAIQSLVNCHKAAS